MVDTEQRLVTLQADYKLLQDSYEQLDASWASSKKEHELEIKSLKTRHLEIEQHLTEVKGRLESSECRFKDKLDKLQLALDQSELELSKCEEKLEVLICYLGTAGFLI